MSMKKSYLEQMDEVEEYVNAELPSFKVLTPKRKVQILTMQLRENCIRRKGANAHKGKESNSIYHKIYREEDEYFELLTSTRLLKKIPLLDEYELSLYVVHLKSKLEEALIERDIKKRFFLYDYITTGCRVCNVENEKIMQMISEIKDNAKQIIQDIPIM